MVQELKRLASLDPEWDWSGCAVITRNWGQLDPVRALCQMEEIPVQVSREDFTATWQLRETQALLNWSQSQGNLLKAGHLLQWVREQPSGPWNELLVEALENYLLETNNEELPAGVFREWLAEWARDNRRRQHGLLLTSAHRAQGLGVRPRRHSGRQLAHRRKGRGHRRSPTSLLRGHDPRQEDPYPGQVRELQPISQIASQSPFSSGPAGAGPNPAGSCGNEAGIPEAQPEGTCS